MKIPRRRKKSLIKCWQCKGKGYLTGSNKDKTPCPNCGGKGRVTHFEATGGMA